MDLSLIRTVSVVLIVWWSMQSKSASFNSHILNGVNPPVLRIRSETNSYKQNTYLNSIIISQNNTIVYLIM